MFVTTNPFTSTRYGTLTLTPSTLGRFVVVVEVVEEEEDGGLLLVCRRFRSPLAADVIKLLIAVASPVVSFGMVVEDRGMGPEANDDSTKRDVHDRIKSGKRHCFMLPTSDRYNAPTSNPHTAGTNVEKYCESIIYHKCNEPFFPFEPNIMVHGLYLNSGDKYKGLIIEGNTKDSKTISDRDHAMVLIKS